MYHTLQISFSIEEMSEYLIKTGRWLVSDVSYTHYEHYYHNRVEETQRSVKIAYPSDIPLENFTINKDEFQLLNWTVDKIFLNEIKQKLLNL